VGRPLTEIHEALTWYSERGLDLDVAFLDDERRDSHDSFRSASSSFTIAQVSLSQ
jgi:hypothetical protein